MQLICWTDSVRNMRNLEPKNQQYKELHVSGLELLSGFDVIRMFYDD